MVAKLIAIEKEFALGAGRVGRGLEHDGNSFAEWSVNAKVYAARRLRLGADGDAVIIGHDWGATATYGATTSQPERWSKAVTLAVPPGDAVVSALLGNLDQLQRSWYMFLFQHPLADLITAAADHEQGGCDEGRQERSPVHAVDIASPGRAQSAA